MNEPFDPGAGRNAWQRGLAGFAGVAVACAVLASVTVLFGDASSMPWLPGTPSNLAAMQRCAGVHTTAAQRACAETVVSSVLARGSATRVAGNDAGERPSPAPR